MLIFKKSGRYKFRYMVDGRPTEKVVIPPKKKVIFLCTKPILSVLCT
jgi:hypothetical protein